MGYSLQTKINETTLIATLSGEVQEQEYLSARAEMLEVFKKSSCRNILLDLRNTKLLTSSLEVFNVAATTSQVIPPGIRYAIVVSPTTLRSDDVKFGEDVAVNRGACLNVFSDLPGAKAWLGEI